MRRLLLIITILSVSFCLNGIAYAEDFTYASLQGNYSIKLDKGPKILGMGVCATDENGNLTGTGSLSFPAPFGQSEILTLSFEGSFELNPDGTGTIPHTGTTSEGVTADFMADFVITDAEVVDGVKMAKEIFFITKSRFQGYPGTATLRRLPD